MVLPLRISRLAAVAALALLGSLATVERAEPDDRDLLRFDSGKPYVFILLDNSGSMTLDAGNNWVPGSGDDPRSKIFQTKKALFRVFESETSFHVGFSTYNQDELRVASKHWLYRVVPSNSLATLGYPTPGEVMTFGALLSTATPGVAGSCASPLPFGTNRERINRFPKLGELGINPSVVWISNAGRTYRLTHTRQAGNLGGEAGDDLTVSFTLERVATCSPLLFDDIEQKNVSLKLGVLVDPDPTVAGDEIIVTDFLMRDLVATDTPTTQAPQAFNASIEPEAGYWQALDAISDGLCDQGGPFSGDGWEGNYDSGVVTGDPDFDPSVVNTDPFSPDGSSLLSRNLLFPTVPSMVARELDYGDTIPMHWTLNNVESMLRRLAPNYNDGSGDLPEFRAAPFFTDTRNLLTGTLSLKDDDLKPILASRDSSPLGDAVADFRCWVQGSGTNKCRTFGAPEGWENVGLREDVEWGCRRPYLIVIGDGGDNCPGENPCADTASLWRKSSVRTWVLTWSESAHPPLDCMAQNGQGEVVLVKSEQQLVDELRKILGVIREESRAFASAAAPSVQAVVEDKVYVSTFVPLNGTGYWDGHLDSFLKPLPLDLAGRPDRTHANFNWDAGAKLVLQAPTQASADTGSLKLGTGQTQRRVFYTRRKNTDGEAITPGQWSAARRLFNWTTDSTDPDIRYDLWEGLGIPYLLDDAGAVDQVAQNRANQVISDTLAIKTHTFEDGTSIEYIFGDVFHSDPLIIGSPADFRLFAQNAGDDGTACEDGNPSYRCFFRRHQYRRKMVVVGSNDGMLHFFDGGTAESTVEDGETVIRFNNGTGQEIAAYIPRPVLPTVRRLSEDVVHRFATDGTPVAADVFIDPVHDGTPVASDREFRTVLITGLREGGTGYLALDITQPDTLDTDNVPEPINTYVPSCLGTPLSVDSSVSIDCDELPFPSPLWEFDDSFLDTTTDEWVRADEDDNGLADLTAGWPAPAIGRIRVCEGPTCDPSAETNDVRDMWVAAIGGGMDQANKLYHPATSTDETLRGNFIYLVDLETGLAVLKRPVDGPVAAGLAAVDTDQDGYLDRIYAVTVSGFVYRVDLDLDAGNAPTLVDQQVNGLNDITYTVRRVPLLSSSGVPYWEPRKIFDANFDGPNPVESAPRSLYHEPSVVFVADLGLYALAFGTGDREDLWSGTDQTGRFYVFVDDSHLLPSASLPLTEADLATVGVNDDNVQANYLTTRAIGERGWYLPLEVDERVITEAFALAGITFFTAFQPDIDVAVGADPLCSKTGESRIFIVNTTNANSFVTDLDGLKTRYRSVATFVTPPYTEQGSGRNITGDGGDGGGSTADDLTDELIAIMDEMKDLFPAECRFANYRIDIKTIASDTGVVFIAPVPVCLMQKNWKEF